MTTIEILIGIQSFATFLLAFLTYRYLKEVQAQRLLITRPVLKLIKIQRRKGAVWAGREIVREPEPLFLTVKNIGHGPALNIDVYNIEATGSEKHIGTWELEIGVGEEEDLNIGEFEDFEKLGTFDIIITYQDVFETLYRTEKFFTTEDIKI